MLLTQTIKPQENDCRNKTVLKMVLHSWGVSTQAWGSIGRRSDFWHLHLALHAHIHQRRRHNFSDWSTKNGESRVGLKNTTYTIFSQPKIECSKLFKLKTIWNDLPVSHNRKSRELHKELKKQKAKKKQKKTRKVLQKELWRYTSYEYVECYLRRWEISSVHYKRGFSGPGYLGGFVEVLFMWCWGFPLFSFVLH